jgi:hypothetical protein
MQAWYLLGVIAIGALIFYMLGLALRNGQIRFNKDDINNSAFTLGILAIFILFVIWICMRILHINT